MTLAPGQHVREINFTLTRQAVISGKVLDDEGDPVAQGQVQVLRPMCTGNGKTRIFPLRRDLALQAPGTPSGYTSAICRVR